MGVIKKRAIPSWMNANEDLLKHMDIGLRYRPFTKLEIADGYIIRGPVVITPTPSTSPHIRSMLPMIAHNIRIFDLDAKTTMLEFEKSPDNLVRTKIRKESVVDAQKQLIILTSAGAVRMRKPKLGDKGFYELGPNFSAKTIDEFVKSLWEAWN